jgi:Cytochrome bd terminal oxidase subunit I
VVLAAHTAAHLTGAAASAGAAKAVVAARTQMAVTLSFHIILACFGVAFPAIVLAVHYRGLRRHDKAALLLARRWSKVMAVLIAVGGAVMLADASLAVLWVSVTAYAALGGADFGGGLWDLLAGSTDRGRRPRALIDHVPGGLRAGSAHRQGP